MTDELVGVLRTFAAVPQGKLDQTVRTLSPDLPAGMRLDELESNCVSDLRRSGLPSC